ncbi:MAG: S1C family serine protease [bacterium]
MVRRGYFVVSIVIFMMGDVSLSQMNKRAFSQIDSEWEMAKYVKKARACVVSVQTFVSDQSKTWWRVGSGFVYNKDGFIVTRQCVVEGGDSIIVTLSDGRSGAAWMVLEDDITGIAVLKFPCDDLSSIALGDVSELTMRASLTVIGNSLGVFPSITLGTYLGTREDGMLGLSIQIPPGSIGSPVLDEKGRVVGVLVGRVVESKRNERDTNTLGIALPIGVVKGVVDDVLKSLDTRRGWVGMSVEDIRDERFGRAVRVVELVPGGPTDRAEICVGDTIIGFEGQSIHSAKELASKASQMRPNRDTVFTLLKEGKESSRTVRIDALPWTRMHKDRQKR